MLRQATPEGYEALEQAARRDPARMLELAQGSGSAQARLLAWTAWAATAAARVETIHAALAGSQRDRSPRVRAQLARLIRALAPDRAADLLCSALASEDHAGTQRRLLIELGQSGEPSAPGTLVALMSRARDASLRRQIADYLSRNVKGDAARQALRRALYASWERLSEMDRLRVQAACGLAEKRQLVADLASRVRDGEQAISDRREALSVLVGLDGSDDDPQVRRALTEAAGPGSALPLRLAALDGLARTGQGAALMAELLASDQSPAVRARAATRLRANDTRQARLLMAAAADDGSAAVRAAAVLRLAGADRRNSVVLATVRDALIGGDADEVRLAAARSLGVLLRRRRERPDGTELSAVVRLARDGEMQRTRLAAVAILQMYGSRQSMEAIASLARTAGDPQVRAQASRMLAVSRRGS